MKQIPLTKGMVALVDDEDYEFLMQWRWKVGFNGYTERSVHLGYINKKKVTKTVYMHREINKTKEGYLTDHIDGNRLNNQKTNLRDVTHSQNMANRKSAKKSSSKFLGVSFIKTCRRFRASICSNKKRIVIGIFCTEIEAAIAYNKEAVKYHGEYARLNVIE